jgi:hypothetical protein
MNKIFAVAMSVLIGLGFAFAAAPSEKGEKITVTGSIIDNRCAANHKDSLASFISSHTKECALMPKCSASGYSIYSKDGALVAFDKASYAKIKKFLKKPESTLAVVVTGTKEESGAIKLATIKNEDQSATK